MFKTIYATARETAKRIVRCCDLLSIPKHITAHFRQVNEAGLDEIRAALTQHFFARFPDGYLATDYGQHDLTNHVVSRIENHRLGIVPWLDAARRLEGCKILEIGCGTGCSTIAMAEQGAEVVGIDVDEPSLLVARKRSEVYGLDVRLHTANAADADEILAQEHFDFVIFWASLEHMVHEERLKAIGTTWNRLSTDGLFCITNTPNRLWYFDQHTSRLPFFNWLPDNLAFKYACFSSRWNFCELYAENSEEKQLDFLRRGRGVSFHEFHLAIGCPVEELNVISSLSAYRRQRNVLRRLIRQPSANVRFESLLASMYSSVHRGWFEPSLNLIIKK
jgi:2-polyprenyl-3-methyl-5-hydroxy-6-metoxy-1,4-benzoquinol methylase